MTRTPVMTSLTAAFNNGFKDSLAGRPSNPSKYAAPLLAAAYERGHKRSEELKRRTTK